MDFVRVRRSTGGAVALAAAPEHELMLQIVGETISLLEIDDGRAAARWQMGQIADLDVDDATLALELTPAARARTRLSFSGSLGRVERPLADVSDGAKKIVRRLSGFGQGLPRRRRSSAAAPPSPLGAGVGASPSVAAAGGTPVAKPPAGPIERAEITFATSERAEEIRRLLEAGPNLYWSEPNSVG